MAVMAMTATTTRMTILRPTAMTMTMQAMMMMVMTMTTNCYSEDAGEDDNDEEDACVPRCRHHIHVRRAATPWRYANPWLHRHHSKGG